jgi:hypothetical protein
MDTHCHCRLCKLGWVEAGDEYCKGFQIPLDDSAYEELQPVRKITCWMQIKLFFKRCFKK